MVFQARYTQKSKYVIVNCILHEISYQVKLI